MRSVLGRLGLMPLAKPLSSDEGRKILERDRHCCRYCGLDGMTSFENSLVMSVDFVIPRAQKGTKKSDNLVTACRACNVIKGRRLFKNFDEAKAYVLNRRAELRQEWATKTGRRMQTASS
jgi:5-methylcytosine-specific restriction endonuclease McrA